MSISKKEIADALARSNAEMEKYSQSLNTQMDIHEKIANLIDKSNSSIASYFKTSKDINNLEKKNLQLANERKKLEEQLNTLREAQSKIEKKILKTVDEEKEKALKSQLELLTKNLTALEKQSLQLENNIDANNEIVRGFKEQTSLLGTIGQSIQDNLVNRMVNFSKSIYGYFNEADRAIKDLNLSLGKSGANSAMLRDNMTDVAMQAAYFGLSVKDLASIQERYAEATGKANGLRRDELNSVMLIAKGTSLGSEAAGEMVGNFETIGLSAVQTKNFVEKTVNLNEKFGVNSGKVLKTINQNFSKLNEYRFQNGVEGLAKMSRLAEITKISIESTFSAIDKFRTLQGTLEASARLMTMGGKFAQADPFKLSFLSRNQPEKFAQSIADMTRGIATFNKETREFELSALDMDRLREVSEATGISVKELAASAKEVSKIDLAKKSIFIGTKEDRDFLGRMAKFGDNGRMVVEIDGQNVDLQNVTKSQLDVLKGSAKNLKERADAAKTFDEIFVNTVNELKASLLPFLKQFNALATSLNSFIDGIDNNKGVWQIMGSIAVIAGATLPFIAAAGGIKSILGGIGDMISNTKDKIVDKLIDKSVDTAVNRGGSLLNSGASAGATASNYSFAASLAAVGVAAAGIGFGIKQATEGFASLATAMKGLTGSEMEGLKDILLGVGIGIVAIGGGLAALAYSPAGPGALLMLGGITASFMGISWATRNVLDGITDVVTGIGKLSNVNYAGILRPINDLINVDLGKLQKLEDFFTNLSQIKYNNFATLEQISKDGIKLVLPDKVPFNIEIDFTATLDKTQLSKQLAKQIQVEIYKGKTGKSS
jgi:hypothetical protein